MISKVENRLRKVCRNYEQVENYEKAIADEEQIWDLHHRREIDENKSAKQLQEEGRYYDVDPSELIFLTISEHRKLHNAGKTLSEETKQKLSNSHKGKTLSEETRKKLSYSRTGEKNGMFGKGHLLIGEKNGMFGKHHEEESRNKISEVKKSKELHWWNNGKTSIMSKECPGEGFVRGRLKLK